MASGVTQSNQAIDETSLSYVLDFQRHEWKYYLPNDLIEIIIPEILPYMDYDPYCEGGKYYDLFSVYYDTEDWQSYYEKLDGIERRKKFRLRSYVQNPKGKDLVMMEVKEKNKDIILKRRASVDISVMEKLRYGLPSSSPDAVYDEWRFNIVRNAIKPRILIAYQRLAFKAKHHPNLRITLDRHIQHGMVKDPSDPFATELRNTQFSRKYSVLEIKFKDNPPKFVIDLVKKYNLSNEAISKFCESVTTNYSLIN